MIEKARRDRNSAKLAECYPAFRSRLSRVIAALERQGFRPRIQEAYRSPASQQRAYERGTSKLRYGLHNATGPGGRKEALAADVLDDDHPTAPPVRYLLALAVAAVDAGLGTGILWGLSGAYKTRTAAAIRSRDIDAKVRVGWDPTHVQVTGLTGAQVRAGRRPSPGTEPAAPQNPAPARPAPVPTPAPVPEEDDVNLALVKTAGDPKVYLVVLGRPPVHVRSQKALADLRRLFPGLGDVETVDPTTLATLGVGP